MLDSDDEKLLRFSILVRASIILVLLLVNFLFSVVLVFRTFLLVRIDGR